MKIQNVELEIVKGDGADLDIDAVVLESVEDTPQSGAEILTTSGGERHYYTIITSLFFQGNISDVEAVRSGYVDVLKKSAELGVRVVALVPFGYEKGVIDPGASAKVLAQELLKFIRFGRHKFEKVYICITDTDHFDVFKNNITGYLTHIQDTLGMGPYVTVDVIIEVPDGIVIIERTNPPYGWALPGGFVDYGESLETAVEREAKEETGLELKNLRQFKTYSEPDRDPRFHTVSTVFIAEGIGIPRAGDDAANLKIVSSGELLEGKYAFDHRTVLEEYLQEVRCL